jgi:hypothetical protein
MSLNDSISLAVSASLQQYMDEAPRSKQADKGVLGPSDIGFCRQKAALMTLGVPPTDNPPKWSAAVGTAIHNYVEAALKESNPDWLMGSIDKIRVTAVLPSGAEISGHPDIVVPDMNMVLDIKTVDGFSWVKREGTQQAHKFQRHLYAMGLLEAGILTEEKPVLVGNVYLDRSGKDPKPFVLIDEMDPTLTAEIDSWVADVIYAVRHKEDASRDVASPVCERICSHFTACRGGLPDQTGELIEDESLLLAVKTYVEAREAKKESEALQKEAQTRLAGVSGSTGEYQVRWTEIQPSVVNSFQKEGYLRMDVRKIRSR